MSVSRGSGDDELHRLSVVLNLDDSGTTPVENEAEVVADEDRIIVGWTPAGSTLPYNSSHEVSITGYVSRKQPRTAAEGSYTSDEKHSHMFTAGWMVQNDATNGLGYSTNFNCETTMLPEGEYIEWNEDVPLIFLVTQYQSVVGEPVEITVYWKEA